MKGKFAEQHAWDAHHQSIDDCRVHGLEQMMYFIYRDLIFMRDVRFIKLLDQFIFARFDN